MKDFARLVQMVALCLLFCGPSVFAVESPPHPVFAEGGLVQSFSPNFRNVTLWGDRVVFLTGTEGGSDPTQLVASDGESLTVLGNTATPYPVNPQFTFSTFHGVDSDGENLFLAASSESVLEGGHGLFRYRDGAFTVLVEQAGALTPTGASGSIFVPRAGGGRVVFTVQSGPFRGHFLHNGSSARKIAEEGEATEDGDGTLAQLPVFGLAISPNGEHVAVLARTDSFERFAVFRDTGSGLKPVARVGDEFGDGLSINRIDNAAILALNDGSIVFQGLVSGILAFPILETLAVRPDDEITRIPRPVIGTFTPPPFTPEVAANDGTHFYARFGLGSFPTETVTARFDVEGNFEIQFRPPFESGGRTWGNTFAFADADARGYLLIAAAEDEQWGVFTNIREIGFPPPLPRSVWRGFPLYVGGWRWSMALGWVYDQEYPFVYSHALEGWTWVLPEDATTTGFYFYSYADDAWFWGSEAVPGWIYRFAGGGQASGWVRTFEF